MLHDFMTELLTYVQATAMMGNKMDGKMEWVYSSLLLSYKLLATITELVN